MAFTEKDIIAKLSAALVDIDNLKDQLVESREEILALNKKVEDQNDRLDAYDLLAAKWGGACMLAMAVGAWVVANWEKAKSGMLALLVPGK